MNLIISYELIHILYYTLILIFLLFFLSFFLPLQWQKFGYFLYKISFNFPYLIPPTNTYKIILFINLDLIFYLL